MQARPLPTILLIRARTCGRKWLLMALTQGSFDPDSGDFWRMFSRVHAMKE